MAYLKKIVTAANKCKLKTKLKISNDLLKSMLINIYLNPSKSSIECFSCVSNICIVFSDISLSWDNSSTIDL